MTHYIITAAAIFLVICGLIAAFGMLILGFSAVTAMLNIPPWVPLVFAALASAAGAIAEGRDTHD